MRLRALRSDGPHMEQIGPAAGGAHLPIIPLVVSFGSCHFPVLVGYPVFIPVIFRGRPSVSVGFRQIASASGDGIPVGD